MDEEATFTMGSWVENPLTSNNRRREKQMHVVTRTYRSAEVANILLGKKDEVQKVILEYQD